MGFALALAPEECPADSLAATQAALRQAQIQPQAVRQGWPPGYSPSGGEADLAGFTAQLSAGGMVSPTLLRYGALPVWQTACGQN